MRRALRTTLVPLVLLAEFAALALLAGLSLGCARTVREFIVEEKKTEIFLRGQVKGGQPVDQGYEHPKQIAPVRVAHILSRIDLRLPVKKGTEREPAISTDMLYPLADGISKALAAADSSQQVVVMVELDSKHLFIFETPHLTSFLCYIHDDLLYIHLRRVGWKIPDRRRKRPPEPRIDEHVMAFSIIPSHAMALVDSQSVAVEWRDPVFRKPTRTRITPSGDIVRRQILMEDLSEVEDPTDDTIIPPNLAPATLRRLADLEEIRRSGEINEAEYTARRRGIIRSDPASRR